MLERSGIPGRRLQLCGGSGVQRVLGGSGTIPRPAGVAVPGAVGIAVLKLRATPDVLGEQPLVVTASVAVQGLDVAREVAVHATCAVSAVLSLEIRYQTSDRVTTGRAAEVVVVTIDVRVGDEPGVVAPRLHRYGECAGYVAACTAFLNVAADDLTSQQHRHQRVAAIFIV